MKKKGNSRSAEEEAEEDEIDDEEEDDDNAKKAGGGFFSAYERFKQKMAGIQNSVGDAADSIEGIQNLFRWRDVRKSKLLMVILAVATIALSFIPFRWVLVAAALHKWTKRLKNILVKKWAKKKTRSPELNFIDRLPTNPSLMPSKLHLPAALRRA